MNKHLHHAQKLLSTAFSLLTSGVAIAGPDTVAVPSPVGTGDVLSVAGGLILVVASIFLVSFFYTRLKGPRLGGNSVINIVASQAIGPKERILLIDIANTQLVVGMTTTQVQTLHVFEQPVVKVEDVVSGFNFAERLKLALRGEQK